MQPDEVVMDIKTFDRAGVHGAKAAYDREISKILHADFCAGMSETYLRRCYAGFPDRRYQPIRDYVSAKARGRDFTIHEAIEWARELAWKHFAAA